MILTLTFEADTSEAESYLLSVKERMEAGELFDFAEVMTETVKRTKFKQVRQDVNSGEKENKS